MDRLKNLIIDTAGALKRYDFAHSAVELFEELNLDTADRLTDGNDAIKEASNIASIAYNLQFITNKLGLNDILYRIKIAKNNAPESNILKEKYERAETFTKLISHFILLIIHSLYYIDFQKLEKSTIPLNKCLSFGIEIGKLMANKMEERLNDEYNIAKILEAEFGVKGNKNKK